VTLQEERAPRNYQPYTNMQPSRKRSSQRRNRNVSTVIPFGCVEEDRTSPIIRTNSHRSRTVDTYDEDVLVPTLNDDVRVKCRGAWESGIRDRGSRARRVSRQEASPPESRTASNAPFTFSDSDDRGESIVDDLPTSGEPSVEQQDIHNELKRLREKIVRMEQRQRQSTSKQSRERVPMDSTSDISTSDEPRSSCSSIDDVSPPQRTQSLRREVPSKSRRQAPKPPHETDVTSSSSDEVSDDKPQQYRRSASLRRHHSLRSRRQEENSCNNQHQAVSSSSSDEAEADSFDKVPTDLSQAVTKINDEPWGHKGDQEPTGDFGTYPGEKFQIFSPGVKNRDAAVIKFLTSATPADTMVMTQLIRSVNRPGASKRKPMFSFVLQSGGAGHEGKDIHLVDTKRTFKGKHIYYTFHVGKTYLGKLKCNLSAKKFTLFNDGVKVTKSGMIPFDQRDATFREALASVNYTKVGRGPRQLVASIPSNSDNGSLFMVNKIPTWDTEMKVFTLKYHHRAHVKSVKNFQLVPDCSVSNPPVLLRFGKTEDHVFNLDFRGPLSPLQALSFALTSFEKNWAENIM